ncbi:TPA: mercury(II) reductase [Legionella pneumophila]|uniref:Mercuric reductase n=1 Tax=Legionella steelei TaxID=947033 RepID=A0A0W0ZRN7_9GAMM|nr:MULTISPECIES: mercury(II) reductase [Legionella]KTD71716.1 oxydoreductase [Legionella steelei]MBN9229608.1 mercury(II) reductase [Legionella sp.]MCW8399330.1 mercury(II) reductase [Legionella sp. PATHC038]
MSDYLSCPDEIGSANTSPDILVIGAGSAGFSAAITAAEEGAHVLMVDNGILGGTCVNVGCVPSKNMIRATETIHQANQASRFDGIEASGKLSNWYELIQQKQALVDTLRVTKYVDVLQAYKNINYVKEQARIVNHGVMVGNQLYTPTSVIIATGASASIPPIDGIHQIPYLTSTTALDLHNQPKSLLVIGGGVVGVELGQMFARAGTKVTICCRSRLVPTSEPEISMALTHYLQQEGIDVCQGIGYQKIEEIDGYIRLTHDKDGDTRIIEAEQVLIATGRTPNTSGFGLNESDIILADNGGIRVNQYMQSSRDHIYAVGDVTGVDMFVYMAAYGAKLAALNALEGNQHCYDNSTMPTVIFTDPQVADVGYTEASAKLAGYEVKVSVLGLEHVPRFFVARDTRGLIKLVADKKTDKLLGAHILSPEAGDLIQTIVIALKAQFTIKDLANTLFPYLTGVEGVKLAALSFDKDVNKLSCCAG